VPAVARRFAGPAHVMSLGPADEIPADAICWCVTETIGRAIADSAAGARDEDPKHVGTHASGLGRH
jgi:hypothetical protein